MGPVVMNESGVRSQYAEDVCEFVWLALAAYDRTQRTTSNIADWQQTGNEPSRAVLSAICEIASYVEAFAAESFIDHAETVSSMCVEPIPKIVRESVRKPLESTWKGRLEFIKIWLDPEYGSTDSWKEWMGFVEARNAWAHGQGKLTKRQLQNQEVRANIKRSGLTVTDGLISGSAEDVRKCACIAVEFIDWIDQRVKRS